MAVERVGVGDEARVDGMAPDRGRVADDDEAVKKAFYEYPIDEEIKSRVDEIVMFTADDEEKEGKESL